MAKLFLTLAILCVFGAVMVKGLDLRVLKIFMPHVNTCKAEVKANDGKKEIHFLIKNLNKK